MDEVSATMDAAMPVETLGGALLDPRWPRRGASTREPGGGVRGGGALEPCGREERRVEIEGVMRERENGREGERLRKKHVGEKECGWGMVGGVLARIPNATSAPTTLCTPTTTMYCWRTK
jgi:hypothetical protein